MDEKITYGIKNVHYAQKTEDQDGAPLFGSPDPLIGADEISLPPVGDPIIVHADDVEYYRLPVNQGYEGNINVRQIPEKFRLSHLGEYKDTNGVLIEKDGIKPDNFALLGEFTIGDENATAGKRFVLYDCAAGRADLSGKTKEDAVDPALFSVPITARPTKPHGFVKATIKRVDNQGIYDAWFDSVYFNPEDELNKVVTITVKKSGDASTIQGAVVVIGSKIGITDSDGTARISLPSGTYDVMVSAAGYAAETDTVTVADSAVDKTVEMTAS